MTSVTMIEEQLTGMRKNLSNFKKYSRAFRRTNSENVYAFVHAIYVNGLG